MVLKELTFLSVLLPGSDKRSLMEEIQGGSGGEGREESPLYLGTNGEDELERMGVGACSTRRHVGHLTLRGLPPLILEVGYNCVPQRTVALATYPCHQDLMAGVVSVD